jgi:hypothetical protein
MALGRRLLDARHGGCSVTGLPLASCLSVAAQQQGAFLAAARLEGSGAVTGRLVDGRSACGWRCYRGASCWRPLGLRVVVPSRGALLATGLLLTSCWEGSAGCVCAGGHPTVKLLLVSHWVWSNGGIVAGHPGQGLRFSTTPIGRSQISSW